MTTEHSIQEILERTIRLESRVVQLGDHVGANLRTKLRIDVLNRSGHTFVEVDALDVSLSRIFKELEARLPAEIRHSKPIDVMHQGHLVATLYP